jgi:hypothetical protein
MLTKSARAYARYRDMFRLKRQASLRHESSVRSNFRSEVAGDSITASRGAVAAEPCPDRDCHPDGVSRRQWLRQIPLGFLVLLFTSAIAGAAAAPATPVAVQLVLAVDVSGSVDRTRFELQREGYSAAFRSPAVQQAIRSTATGSIAVAMLQWTGPALHVVAVDWTLIDDTASVERFADAIARAPRALFGGGTSISGAIDYALTMFARSPFPAQRNVIDVSGDGANNRGRPAEDARDDAIGANVVINGLPILTLEPDLDVYYRQNVIGGPGAFVIAVRSYEEFAQAIRSKLVTEIAVPGGSFVVIPAKVGTSEISTMFPDGYRPGFPLSRE